VTLNNKVWEISEPENELLSLQGDDCLGEFFPQVQNKWGKLIAFIISIMSVFGPKWFKYETDNNQKNKNKEPKQDTKTTTVLNDKNITIREGE